MNVVELIGKKKCGEVLSPAEIDFLVRGFTNGEIPDYQMAALLMAICWRGLDERETGFLTRAMISTGETLDLALVAARAVDKHSTGGVGDKTTLVVAPIVASFGVPVAKMSGRGLGHTGGTLDKLESIPGFRTTMSLTQFMEQLAEIGIVISGQSRDLVPADGMIYALRDATATVDNIPLIASSIMSKKIASGSPNIVLDVKVGIGAFMKTLDDARDLARALIRIGEGFGRRVTALLTNMNQPLGLAVGNALEVREVIETLLGKGPADLATLSCELAAHMLHLSGRFSSVGDGRDAARRALFDGSAIAKFRQLIRAQGGQADALRNPKLLPVASEVAILASPQSGYISRLDALKIGVGASLLGAGRRRKDDLIDPAAGILLRVKRGDKVVKGDAILEMHATDLEQIAAAKATVLDAFQWSDQPPSREPLVFEVLGG